MLMQNNKNGCTHTGDQFSVPPHETSVKHIYKQQIISLCTRKPNLKQTQNSYCKSKYTS